MRIFAGPMQMKLGWDAGAISGELQRAGMLR